MFIGSEFEFETPQSDEPVSRRQLVFEDGSSSTTPGSDVFSPSPIPACHRARREAALPATISPLKQQVPQGNNSRDDWSFDLVVAKILWSKQGGKAMCV